MIIFYSYIGPIFTTAIKRNQPETAEETYTQTVSILKNTTNRQRCAKIISGFGKGQVIVSCPSTLPTCSQDRW